MNTTPSNGVRVAALLLIIITALTLRAEEIVENST